MGGAHNISAVCVGVQGRGRGVGRGGGAGCVLWGGVEDRWTWAPTFQGFFFVGWDAQGSRQDDASESVRKSFFFNIYTFIRGGEHCREQP